MKTPIFFSLVMAASIAIGAPKLCAEDPAAKSSSPSAKKSVPAGVSNTPGAAANSAGSSSTVDRTELFRSMDLNHDGKISPEEFAHYQASHGGTGLNPTPVTPQTPKASSNKDAGTSTAPSKDPVKRNGDTGQSDALYNTAPDTGRSGSEAGRPAR